MKKSILIALLVLFVLTGCITKKKENPEPDIAISTDTLQIIDNGSIKINFVSEKSETVNQGEIEVVTNASEIDVELNGTKVDLINGVLYLANQQQNKVKFTAKRDILGEEFKASKEMTVIRSDIADAKGGFIFPNSSTLYNSYGLAEDGNAGAKKAATKGVAALGNIVYRAVTTKDITDVPVVKAELQGVYAEVPVTGLAGGSWTNGNSATIYVVLNGSIVDQITGTVVNGYVQYKTNPADTAEKITIGKPLSTSLGAATEYNLMEGENSIYLFIVNATDSTKPSIRVGDGSNPVTFTVDTIRPTLNITTPLNDGYLSYDHLLGGSQNIKLKANAKDSNWVYMYGAIMSTVNTATITEDFIDDYILQKDGSQIKNENELELAVTTADISVLGTADGTKDYLVLMAMDKNGNCTIRFVTVSEAPAFTSDENALEVRDGIGSQTTALYNKYVENVAITDTNISFRYTLQAGEVGSTVKIVRKTISTANVPVELPVSKTLTPTTGEPRILVGEYNLMSDFGYTAEEIAKPELNMSLYLKITDINGGETEIQLTMRHIVFSELVKELKLSKGDLEFKTSGDAVFAQLPNGYSDKIYFTDSSDGDADSKVDIGKITITKPVNREYVVQIGTETYYVDDDNTITFTTDKVMNVNSPVLDVYIYLREVSSSSLLGKFTAIYLADPASTVTVDETVIKQNQGKVEITGSINMPISVVSEYTFSTTMTNNSGDQLLRDSGIPLFKTYTADTTTFTCTMDFNYSDSDNYKYDILNLNLKNKDNIIVTTPKTINLESVVNDDSMSVYKIDIEGLSSESTIWSIPVTKQRIYVSNDTDFAELEFLFDGQKDTTFTNGSYYNTLGSKSTLTIRGKIPGVEVWVERKLTIKLVSTTAPTFENKDSAKKVTVVKDTNNVMKVKGYVTNHKNTLLNIYIDDVLLDPITNNAPPYILYEGTDNQYAYSTERPFITVDLGSPTRQGKDFTIKLTATDPINQITGYYIITDPTYYDTYAPTEYYPGKNGNANRRFPDEWIGVNAANSLDRFYVKYDSTAHTSELYVDDKLSEEDYNTAVGLGYIEKNLSIGISDYHLITKDGTNPNLDIKFTFQQPNCDDGYFAVVQNQAGSSDYIIGTVPTSQSDADYTTIDADKNELIYVVIKKDSENEIWLTVDPDTDTVTSNGIPTALVDGVKVLQAIAGTRSFVYNIGDNTYNKITVKLADKHKIFTQVYTFTNTNSAPISTTVASAEIIEGSSVGVNNNVSRVVIGQVPNLKGTTVAIYRDSALTNLILQETDLDLTGGETYYNVSNVRGGDKVYLVVTDKYGNKIKGGSLTLTFVDKVPPVLPNMSSITADNSGATSDVLTFEVEPAAETFFINSSTIPSTYAGQVAANVAKVVYTDVKDTVTGIITSRKVVATIPRSSNNKDLKLVMADSYKNLTYDSKFDNNQYLDLSSKVVYQYTDSIPGDIAVNAVNGASPPYGLDESFSIDWEDITTGDLQYYKVVFVVDGVAYTINDKLTTSELTVKGQDIVDKYKIPAFNYQNVEMRVSGISKKGIEGNYKTPNNPVYIDTKRPDVAGIVNKSKILAYVSSDDVITFETGSFDRVAAGLGATGDNVYVVVCSTTVTGKTTITKVNEKDVMSTTYTAVYDATKNSILATKVWPENTDSVTISGTGAIGAIENTSFYMIRIMDEAGNLSAVPTTTSNYIVQAIDDEAPKLEYLTVGSMSVGTGSQAYFGTIPLKYSPPSNAGEGSTIKVYVYAYSDIVNKTGAKLISTAVLEQIKNYEVGTSASGVTPLQIDFSKYPTGAISPDASLVFIRLGDATGNVTDITDELSLDYLITNQILQ